MEILLSKNAITIYEIVILLILIVILVRQMKKKKETQIRKEISNAKMRNIMLEEKLKNPDSRSEWSLLPSPFDVQYVPTPSEAKRRSFKFQVEVEVHTETSVQRYLFDLDKEITIGQDEGNVLPVKDNLAAQRNCSILMKNQSVYVKNLSSAKPVCIQRGKKKQLVQEQMIKLQSKDILTVGKTPIHISLYEN